MLIAESPEEGAEIEVDEAVVADEAAEAVAVDAVDAEVHRKKLPGRENVTNVASLDIGPANVLSGRETTIIRDHQGGSYMAKAY